MRYSLKRSFTKKKANIYIQVYNSLFAILKVHTQKFIVRWYQHSLEAKHDLNEHEAIFGLDLLLSEYIYILLQKYHCAFLLQVITSPEDLPLKLHVRPAREITWEGACFAVHMTRVEAEPYHTVKRFSAMVCFLSPCLCLYLKKLARSGEYSAIQQEREREYKHTTGYFL